MSEPRPRQLNARRLYLVAIAGLLASGSVFTQLWLRSSNAISSEIIISTGLWLVVFILSIIAGELLLRSWELFEEKRKLAEQKLEDLALLQVVTNTAPTGMLITDQEGRWYFHNDRMVEMWGLDQAYVAERYLHPPSEEFFEIVRRMVVDPEAMAGPILDLPAYANDGNFHDFIKFYDGRTYERFGQAAYINGEYLGNVWFYRDITDLLRTRAELDDTKALHESVVSSSPAPIISVTTNLEVSSWNEAATSMYGWTCEEVLGRPLPFVPEEEWETILNHHQQVFEQGQPVRQRRLHRHKNGRPIHAEVVLAPLRNHNGETQGGVSLHQDVTDQVCREVVERLGRSLKDGVFQSRPFVETCEELLRDLCTEFYLVLGWVAEARADGTLTVVAAGGSGKSYVEHLTVRWDEGPYANGPAGLAIRQQMPIIAETSDPMFKPWRELTTPLGINSALAIPLFDGAQMLGVFALYSSRPYTFQDRSICQHLEELARELELVWLWSRSHTLLKRQQVVLATTANGVIISDSTGTMIWVNEALEQMTGFSSEELLNKTPAMLKSGNMPAEFYAKMWEELRQGKPFSGDFENRRKDGSLYYVHQTITPIQGHDGGTEYYVGIQEDITAKRLHEAELVRVANTDYLTGLGNRKHFHEVFDHFWKRNRREHRPLALISLGMNRFKDINDLFGHHLGDTVLTLVVGRWTKIMSEGLKLYRLGGDEFVALIDTYQDSAEVERFANLLLASLEDPVKVNRTELRLHAAAGIAYYHPDDREMTPGRLLQNAQIAMYSAKETYRSSLHIHDETLASRMRREKQLEQELPRALTKNEFQVLFQPKFNLRTLQIGSCEALVRWIRGGKVVSYPNEFIPIAERSNDILELGLLVLEQSCLAARRMTEAAGQDFVVSVNVSVAQLQDQHLVSKVQQAFEKTGVPPRLIEFELTESAFARDIQRSRNLAAALSELGSSLSLDDFGTGYSSLAYLGRYPVDCLKIDRQFVLGIGHRGPEEVVVGAIIALGHSLGMSIVAEGVETEAQREFLLENGCDMGQGYLVSPAIPLEELHRKVLTQVRG